MDFKQTTMDQQTSDLLRKKVLGFKQLNPPPRLLLGPGPCNAAPTVLQAMGLRQTGHLDPHFINLMNETQDLMRYAFQTTNEVTFPISGTGSCAMEVGFANLIEKDDVVLVFNAGYFSQRMMDMASRYGAVVKTVDREWCTNFSFEEIKAGIEEHKPKIVCIVHADTSTGVLQPIDGVGELVHAIGGYLIVDTVTSLGGLPVYVDKWGIDVAYSGTQKCLACPPGVAPLTVSAHAMKFISTRKTKVANWYLDLNMLTKYWNEQRKYHHTAPINMIYGIREALRIIAEEGLDARWERHAANAKLLWDGLEKLGLKLLVDESYRLPSLATVAAPEGVNTKYIQQVLLNEFNIEIGGGLGKLGGKAWRIGLMGFNSRKECVVSFLAALEYALTKAKSSL